MKCSCGFKMRCPLNVIGWAILLVTALVLFMSRVPLP
jgi:hypothetical protein